MLTTVTKLILMKISVVIVIELDDKGELFLHFWVCFVINTNAIALDLKFSHFMRKKIA